MIRLEVTRGASADWTIQGRTRVEGLVPTGWQADDALAARVWPGDDQATVLSPAIAWVDAPTCQFTASVSDADTSALEPGAYLIQVTGSRGGRTALLAEAAFVVLPAPGSAAPPAVYCTAADLTRQCGWIEQYQNLDADQTGFAEQRAEAREWSDGLILSAYQGAGQSQSFEGMPTWGRSSLLTDPWLSAILANGGLLLTGERGKKMIRANAYYALSVILRTCLGPGDKLREEAYAYEVLANDTVATLIAEIDTNADGVADMAIALCTSNTRRG